MSTFGYRRGLSKYESIDEDELLASLSAEELKELERELEDIEPDRNLPVGMRQKSLTEKTPTGNFSREALMAYWEKESQKLLEKERLGECGKVAEEDKEESEEELIFTESNSEVSEEVCTEEEEEEEQEESQEEEEEEEEEDSEDEETTTGATKRINGTINHNSVNSDNAKPKTFKSQIENINLTNGSSGGTQRNTESPAAIHPCGNPTVIEDALEKIKNNDPDTTEVNLNNIENITTPTLSRFADALKENTVVKSFSLANTHADDAAAIAIAEMLKVNEHITSVNVESNFITGKGILAIMRALQHNTVLTELRFHNQRHIMGSQVEMEIVKLLKENTTLLRLGYHFELPGPRMSMTSILTRNMDKQRQKRMQEQKQQEGYDGGAILRTKVWQRGTPGSSPYASPRQSPWSSPKVSKKVHTGRSRPPSPVATPPPPPPLPPHMLPPPPPPPPPPLPEKKLITRNIAEVIKQQESAQRALQNGQRKKKGKKVKKQPNNILKEIKNSLRSVQEKKMEDSSRPSTPQRSAHENLMEAIRGSSIRQLRRVEVPDALR